MNLNESAVSGASADDVVVFQVSLFGAYWFWWTDPLLTGFDGLSFGGLCLYFLSQERLWRTVPLIVVEPTDGAEVESGELRWPPDDVTTGLMFSVSHPGVPVEEAEPEQLTVGGL
uniref:LBH domain-containing protein n=1 Tax=Sphaeramia orbicularis TaxID=375764 RepID=A0A672ZSM3_9TELE